MIIINRNLKKINGKIYYPDSFNYLKQGQDFFAMRNADGDTIVETVIEDGGEIERRINEWQKCNPEHHDRTERLEQQITASAKSICNTMEKILLSEGNIKTNFLNLVYENGKFNGLLQAIKADNMKKFVYLAEKYKPLTEKAIAMTEEILYNSKL